MSDSPQAYLNHRSSTNGRTHLTHCVTGSSYIWRRGCSRGSESRQGLERLSCFPCHSMFKVGVTVSENVSMVCPGAVRLLQRSGSMYVRTETKESRDLEQECDGFSWAAEGGREAIYRSPWRIVASGRRYTTIQLIVDPTATAQQSSFRFAAHVFDSRPLLHSCSLTKLDVLRQPLVVVGHVLVSISATNGRPIKPPPPQLVTTSTCIPGLTFIPKRPVTFKALLLLSFPSDCVPVVAGFARSRTLGW